METGASASFPCDTDDSDPNPTRRRKRLRARFLLDSTLTILVRSANWDVVERRLRKPKESHRDYDILNRYYNEAIKEIRTETACGGGYIIHIACSHGPKLKMKGLQAILNAEPESGWSGQQVDGKGSTPLHVLIENGVTKIDILKLLLDNHPEAVTMRNKWGCTPLFHVMAYDNIEKSPLELLLSTPMCISSLTTPCGPIDNYLSCTGISRFSGLHNEPAHKRTPLHMAWQKVLETCKQSKFRMRRRMPLKFDKKKFAIALLFLRCAYLKEVNNFDFKFKGRIRKGIRQKKKGRSNATEAVITDPLETYSFIVEKLLVSESENEMPETSVRSDFGISDGELCPPSKVRDRIPSDYGEEDCFGVPPHRSPYAVELESDGAFSCIENIESMEQGNLSDDDGSRDGDCEGSTTSKESRAKKAKNKKRPKRRMEPTNSSRSLMSIGALKAFASNRTEKGRRKGNGKKSTEAEGMEGLQAAMSADSSVDLSRGDLMKKVQRSGLAQSLRSLGSASNRSGKGRRKGNGKKSIEAEGMDGLQAAMSADSSVDLSRGELMKKVQRSGLAQSLRSLGSTMRQKGSPIASRAKMLKASKGFSLRSIGSAKRRSDSPGKLKLTGRTQSLRSIVSGKRPNSKKKEPLLQRIRSRKRERIRNKRQNARTKFRIAHAAVRFHQWLPNKEVLEMAFQYGQKKQLEQVEEKSGFSPLHLAVKHEADKKIIQLLLRECEKAAGFKSAEGQLPMHLLLSKTDSDCDSALVEDMLKVHPDSIRVMDEKHNLLPFMLPLLSYVPPPEIKSPNEAKMGAIQEYHSFRDVTTTSSGDGETPLDLVYFLLKRDPGVLENYT